MLLPKPSQEPRAKSPEPKNSDPPALWRTAAVVRDRRHVLDALDVETARGKRADGGLTSRSRSLHLHIDAADAVLLRQLSRVLSSHLGSERRSLAGTFEADAARARPGQHIADRIGD